MKDTWRARFKPLEVEIRTISTLIVFGVHIAPSIFRDGELRQPGKPSRHHTKDKQRLVLSGVPHDSPPKRQHCHLAFRDAWREPDVPRRYTHPRARTLRISHQYRHD